MGTRLTLSLALAALLLLVLWLLLPTWSESPSRATARGAPLGAPPSDAEPRASAPLPKDAVPQGVREESRAAEIPTTAPAEPLASLRGRLRFRDERPAAGLEVRLLCAGEERSLSTRSAADGTFAFAVPAGRHQLGGAGTPEALAWCQEVELAAGRETFVEHVFHAPHDLCVRVWQIHSGAPEPLSGAAVQILSGGLEFVDRGDACACLVGEGPTTDPEGRVTVRHGADDNSLCVTRPGFHPAWIEANFSWLSSYTPLSADGCLHVVLEREGPVIAGTLLDPDGRPIQGALVVVHAPFAGQRAAFTALALDDINPQLALSRPFALTDERGRFALAGPDPEAGPYRSLALVAFPQRAGLLQHVLHPLELTDLGVPLNLVLRVPAAPEVEIELVDERGTPLQGFASLRDPSGPPYGPISRLVPQHLWEVSAGRAFALVDGRFRLVHPGGEVIVGISPQGAWDEREFELELPSRPMAPVRLVMPAR